ncbi:MAG: YerC/YecD family TrpR-related protein, partial [Patescibacteria group bacterium]
MSKFSLHNKLDPSQKENLLIGFFEGLASIKNSEEAAKVFCDLLSPPELEMMAKRLAIARALLEGQNYQEIKKEYKVSTNTIARVNAWLQEAGDGFRLLAKRTSMKSKSYGKDHIF